MTIGWMDFINLSVGIAGVTMSLLGLLVTLSLNHRNKIASASAIL